MESPKRDRALQEEIICPLCFSVFDNPISLQCLHSYCEDCLYSLHQSKRFADSLDCPECRSVTILGEEGIHGLKANFKLKRIVEILSVEEKREIAKRSGQKPPKPVPRLPPPVPENSAPFCSHHSDKHLNFYCTQCKVLICSQCMLDSHRFHKDPISAQEALKSKISSLKSQAPQAESVITKANAVVDKLQSDIDAIWNLADSDIMLAQEYFQNLKKLLEEREMDVCKSIESRATRHQTRMDKQKKLVVNSLDEVQKTQAAIQDIIERRKDDIQVLIDERNVTQKLDSQMQHLSLLMDKAKDKPRTSYKSPFTPDPDFEAQCKVVGLHAEPSTPTIHPRHTFVNAPAPTRTKVTGLKLSESSRDLGKSVDGSPDLRTPLFPVERVKSGSTSSSHDSPRTYEVDGVTILTPCVVINSSSILGPTMPKQIAASPSGVCTGDQNMLVVTDSKNHLFSMLTPTGKFLDSVQAEGRSDGQFVEPTAVIYDKGKIVVLDKGQPPRVQLFSDSGAFVSKFKVRNMAFCCYLGEPLGMLSVDYKTMLISDSEKSCVHIFDDEGRYRGKFGDTELKTKQPAGMALDSRGNVFIADRGNHCVWIYTCGGQFVSRFGKHGSADGELNYPYGVTIDEKGNIYVSESVNHRISVFTPGGKFVRCFGKKGSEPGMFHYPRHLCVDSQGRLVVADEQNQRLQIFDITD